MNNKSSLDALYNKHVEIKTRIERFDAADYYEDENRALFEVSNKTSREFLVELVKYCIENCEWVVEFGVRGLNLITQLPEQYSEAGMIIGGELPKDMAHISLVRLTARKLEVHITGTESAVDFLVNNKIKCRISSDMERWIQKTQEKLFQINRIMESTSIPVT